MIRDRHTNVGGLWHDARPETRTRFDRPASCRADSSNRHPATIATYPTSRNRPGVEGERNNYHIGHNECANDTRKLPTDEIINRGKKYEPQVEARRARRKGRFDRAVRKLSDAADRAQDALRNSKGKLVGPATGVLVGLLGSEALASADHLEALASDKFRSAVEALKNGQISKARNLLIGDFPDGSHFSQGSVYQEMKARNPTSTFPDHFRKQVGKLFDSIGNDNE